MNSSIQANPLPPTLLLKAARRLLRPLVRLMMRNGLTFPVLTEALRELFVDVAVNDILTDAKARTDSRISLLTGVHRKEIKRLRELASDRPAVPEVVTIISQIVALWVGSPAFTDAAGAPRPLLRVSHGTGAGKAGFDRLVESVTTDIRPRAVLDDLLDQGVVYVDSQDRIQLRAQAFLPRPGGEEQLFYFARNLHDHVASAAANINAAGTPRFLDRSVHYDGLTQEQVGQLEAYARDAATAVLLDVNRRALEMVGEHAPPADTEPFRINFGVFVYCEDETQVGSSIP